MKENAKENELVKKLTNKHYTITTAESCTGGLLSATIINVSGASDVINCAYVTYANEAKENLVSVSHDTLETKGAVSKETADEMCLGWKRTKDCRLQLRILLRLSAYLPINNSS